MIGRGSHDLIGVGMDLAAIPKNSFPFDIHFAIFSFWRRLPHEPLTQKVTFEMEPLVGEKIQLHRTEVRFKENLQSTMSILRRIKVSIVDQGKYRFFACFEDKRFEFWDLRFIAKG